MGTERSSIFGNGDFNVSDFKPTKPPRQNQAETEEAAKAAGFPSREAGTKLSAPPITVHSQRRHRTGRNAQFNLKAKPETISAFCAIADQQGWVLGEALEKAVELLKLKYDLQGGE